VNHIKGRKGIPMRILKLFFTGAAVLVFATTCIAQCNDTEKRVIEVPEKFQTIKAAINEAKTNQDYKGKKVTIKVKYGIYEEDGKGVLIDRNCLDLIGIPNDKKDKPVIKRKNFQGHEQAVVKIRQSDVRLEGFDIDAQGECNAFGILVLIAKYDADIDKDLSNIFIVNNTVRDVGKEDSCEDAHGIVAWSAKPQSINKLWIEKNTLHHLRLGKSETITIKSNVQDFHVNENVIFDTDNIGIDVIGFEDDSFQAHDGEIISNQISDLRKGNSVYPNVAGIYIDGGSDVKITGNTVNGFGLGVQLASERVNAKVSGITVNGNTFSNNLIAGVGVGHDTTQRGFVENCKISDNTILNNGIGLENGKLIDGGQIRLKSYVLGGLKDISIEHNTIYITSGQSVKHLIYTENCIWNEGDGDKCTINPQRLGAAFSRNTFCKLDYTDAWYVRTIDEFDGSGSALISKLNKYMTFADNNIFSVTCPPK
jgi:hypothetical protein